MAETVEKELGAAARDASSSDNHILSSSDPEVAVLRSDAMAKTILKNPVSQETCILELQLKPESFEKELINDANQTVVKDENKSQKVERPVDEIALTRADGQAVDGAFDVKSQTRAPVLDAELSNDSKDRECAAVGENESGFVKRFEKRGLLQLIRMVFYRIFGRFMGLLGNRQKINSFLHGENTRLLDEHDGKRVLNEFQIMNKLYGENERVYLPGIVEEVSADLVRYWLCRYTLFSRFDEGIKLDGQGLFSVTPEEIAKKQATRCGKSGTVIDAFTGAGGNAIQFACMNFDVIAIDIDPKKIEYAQNNAGVYNVSDRIDFIVGDFFQLAPTMKADIVFLSPPWGGPEYIKAEKYDIKTMLEPADGVSLFKLALSVAPSIVYFLPKTVDPEQLRELSLLTDPPLRYEIEKNYVQDELKAVTAYFGKIVG